MSVGPASFYLAFNAMDHMPEDKTGEVGPDKIGMTMSWLPRLKIGDYVWDVGEDIVRHDGCTFVKLCRGRMFARVCFEAFKDKCGQDKRTFTLSASIGYEELINLRNIEAPEARFQAHMKTVPGVLQTPATIDKARRNARRYKEDISFQIMVGTTAIDVLDSRAGSGDLVIKCEFSQLKCVVGYIIERGIDQHRSHRMYNKHANGNYRRPDGRTYVKRQRKSLTSSTDGQAQSAEHSNSEGEGQGEAGAAEDAAEAEPEVGHKQGDVYI